MKRDSVRLWTDDTVKKRLCALRNELDVFTGEYFLNKEAILTALNIPKREKTPR